MTGIDLQASIGLTIGDLEKWGDSVVDRLNGHREPEPFYTTRSASAVQDATPGPITLDLGSPPTGSIWQIRWATTFGWEPFTQVLTVNSGTPPVAGALFVGDPYNLSLAGLLLGGLVIPITRFVPDTVMWCHPNQNLIAQFGYIQQPSGTAFVVQAGQQVGLNVGIEEWKEADVSRKTGH